MSKSSSKQLYLSIVIPSYNEEKRLPKTLFKTIAFLKKQPYESEVIIVSDGSVDNTKDVVNSFYKEFGNLRFIEYFPNLGKGAAVKKGMLAANGKYRLFMDADYAVSIEYITTFLTMITLQYDIVIASRGLRESQIEVHQSLIRELFGKLFGLIQRFVLGLHIIDTQCGFKLFTNEAVEILFPRINFNCAYFDAELLYIANKEKMQIGEIGVRWKHDGQSRLPIGINRSFDILKKLFLITFLHSSKHESRKTLKGLLLEALNSFRLSNKK